VKTLILGDSNCGPLHRAKKNKVFDYELDVIALGAGKYTEERFFSFTDKTLAFNHSGFVKVHEFEITKLKECNLGLCLSLFPRRFVSNVLRSQVNIFVDDGVPRPTITKSLLQEAILHSQKYILELISELRKRDINVFIVPGPRLFHSQWGRDEEESKIQDCFISTTSNVLNKLNVPIVNFPAICLDEKGFMKPHFRSLKEDDLVHGNEEFGVLILDNIDLLLKQE
jgi:hypothetical protein